METLQEFYSFFEAIPHDQWVTGALTHGDKHCALGMLGCKSISFDTLNHDAQLLTKLLSQSRAIPVTSPSGKTGIVWQINDGCYFKEIDNPKERILYAIKLAMDSESIADFLDALALAFLDDFDTEHGIGETSQIQQISGDEFKSLLDHSIPLSVADYVGVKTSDDGFLSSLLQANAEHIHLPNQQQTNQA